MRIATYILLILFSVSVWTGCDFINPPPPADAPDMPPIDSIDPGTAICCGVTHTMEISGMSPTGGQYYVLAVLRQDSIVAVGRPVFIPEGNYSGVELTATVTYLGKVEPGDAVLEVLAFADPEDILDVRQRSMAHTAGIISVANYADSICDICCTDTGHGGQRSYHAGYIHNEAFLIGASANIETKFGYLCGENTPTEDSVDAVMGAWVGIQDAIRGTIDTTPDFCQIGYHRRRAAGTYQNVVYLEAKPVDDQLGYFYWYDGLGFPEPVAGESYDYSVRVQRTQGHLYYDFNGYQFNVSAPHWQDKSVRYVAWKGEISAEESDMPGTLSDSCTFTNCQYRLYTNPLPMSANFGQPFDIVDITSTGYGTYEWGVWVDTGGTTMRIWDVVPIGL